MLNQASCQGFEWRLRRPEQIAGRPGGGITAPDTHWVGPVLGDDIAASGDKDCVGVKSHDRQWI